MPYRIAAIDVHKKMLAVVTADIAVEGEYDFERRQFGTSPSQWRKSGQNSGARLPRPAPITFCAKLPAVVLKVRSAAG